LDTGGKRAMVYVDFENVWELLQKTYQLDEINFFKLIQEKLKTTGLNIIDFLVFGNFEKNGSGKYQTLLRGIGLQVYHTSNNGKNSSDLELTVNALRDLYKNPNIEVFVIVSSDRDIIPLLKAIKYENRLSYVISTKNGFNSIVIQYAELHEYIEDVLEGVPVNETIEDQVFKDFIKINLAKIKLTQVRRAREVVRLFYNSNIWRQSSLLGKPVNLSGYIDVLTKAVNRSLVDITNDFKLAHHLKYVTIYKDPGRGLCLKAGRNSNHVLHAPGCDRKPTGV
jgi:uncharacterized LabA/DUF88 family protein